MKNLILLLTASLTSGCYGLSNANLYHDYSLNEHAAAATYYTPHNFGQPSNRYNDYTHHGYSNNKGSYGSYYIDNDSEYSYFSYPISR